MAQLFPEIVFADLYRNNGKRGFWNLLATSIRKVDFRWILLFRLYQSKRHPFLSRWLLRRYSLKTGIQIGWHSQIGEGLVLVHCGNIAVNNAAVIGKNCTMYHGVTVGMEFRGERKGNPVIGDNVWIGSNACVVGKITIGDDVLIAPLSFVNFDVPSHSIVIGNPARIIPREHATEGYITNPL
jgi:serine O-acetyltransferase